MELLHAAPAFSFLFAAADPGTGGTGGPAAEVRACLPGGGANSRVRVPESGHSDSDRWPGHSDSDR